MRGECLFHGLWLPTSDPGGSVLPHVLSCWLETVTAGNQQMTPAGKVSVHRSALVRKEHLLYGEASLVRI